MSIVLHLARPPFGGTRSRGEPMAGIHTRGEPKAGAHTRGEPGRDIQTRGEPVIREKPWITKRSEGWRKTRGEPETDSSCGVQTRQRKTSKKFKIIFIKDAFFDDSASILRAEKENTRTRGEPMNGSKRFPSGFREKIPKGDNQKSSDPLLGKNRQTSSDNPGESIIPTQQKESTRNAKGVQL